MGYGPTAVGPRYFRTFVHTMLDAQFHHLHSVHNTLGITKKAVKQRIVENGKDPYFGGSEPSPFSTTYHSMRLTLIPNHQLNPSGCFEAAHVYDRQIIPAVPGKLSTTNTSLVILNSTFHTSAISVADSLAAFFTETYLNPVILWLTTLL